MTTMWITRNILVVIFLCHEGKPDDYNKQAAEDLGKHGSVYSQFENFKCLSVLSAKSKEV